MIGKVDHDIGERQKVNAQLAFSNGLFGPAKWFRTIANPGSSNQQFSSRHGSLEHVLTASTQTVNTAAFEASSTTSRSGLDQSRFRFISSLPI